jgi:benzoate-CoA ligase
VPIAFAAPAVERRQERVDPRVEESPMPALSTADHRTTPPRLEIPRAYNAAHDLLERNLAAGRAGKAAFIDDQRSLTYGELALRARRFGDALRKLGIQPEQRVLL